MPEALQWLHSSLKTKVITFQSIHFYCSVRCNHKLGFLHHLGFLKSYNTVHCIIREVLPELAWLAHQAGQTGLP